MVDERLSVVVAGRVWTARNSDDTVCARSDAWWRRWHSLRRWRFGLVHCKCM